MFWDHIISPSGCLSNRLNPPARFFREGIYHFYMPEAGLMFTYGPAIFLYPDFIGKKDFRLSNCLYKKMGFGG
jgi:hypothetical protein